MSAVYDPYYDDDNRDHNIRNRKPMKLCPRCRKYYPVTRPNDCDICGDRLVL